MSTSVIDQAWIDEQKRHFGPDSLDDAIRVWRAYERADREQAARRKAGEAA